MKTYQVDVTITEQGMTEVHRHAIEECEGSWQAIYRAASLYSDREIIMVTTRLLEVK